MTPYRFSTYAIEDADAKRSARAASLAHEDLLATSGAREE
jgi:hypothetical protein